VYPTVQSIFGANGKMTADLQTGNGMIEANVGDTLPDGITIKRISMDGVLVTHDGNEQMLSFGANPLNGSKEGNNAGNGNQNTTSQVRPINPMPMMLPPHLSIGPGMPPSENSTSQ
jgi:hypothetical protein